MKLRGGSEECKKRDVTFVIKRKCGIFMWSKINIIL